MTEAWQNAIVVGASSGIGEAIARRLARGGSQVALVARREQRLTSLVREIDEAAVTGRALAYPHDVRDTARVGDLFQRIVTDLGGLDLVVYAAGVMPRPGPDEYPTNADVEAIDTNFAGAVVWLNEAAGRFTRAGEGTIIGMSSVAGDRGRAGNPVYNASKAALDSYLESLRNRLARRGVSVLTAKPGYVRTPLIEGADLPRFLPVISPDTAAEQVLGAAQAGKRVAYIPRWWRWIMLVVRLVPAPVFERLNL